MQSVKYEVGPAESTCGKPTLYLYYSNAQFDFVRVLENSPQILCFQSCYGNTATPLADMCEMGRFMGFPVLY